MKSIILLVALSILSACPRVLAHCDGLDGPVVQATQKAIETRNVNLVLIWVQETDEAEIKRLFEHTLEVRKLSSQARELADRFFFESLVRIHRAGEGAGFTGLKAAGRDLGPAIPAADKALREGAVKPLLALLTQAVSKKVDEHFAAALRQRDFPSDNISAGRQYVKAYVEYIHAVEALYSLASGPVHGHAPEASAGEYEHH
jgi:hypothetical protein